VYKEERLNLQITQMNLVGKLTLYTMKYQIVTCDAEVADYTTDDRLNLVMNVARFYLRNRATQSILILKWNCAETETICYLTGELQGSVVPQVINGYDFI
jgi:hypothetical protein